MAHRIYVLILYYISNPFIHAKQFFYAMQEKFQHRFRIASARWKNWEYHWPAAYFITIVTKNRIKYFGEIDCVEKMVVLSQIGRIVEAEWLATPTLRPDMNLTLGEFVVMPDHFHAILVIGENDYNQTAQEESSEFGLNTKNLASVIRGFKSSVTSQARKINNGFEWQSRFYDHIIRDIISLEKISAYIVNNPKK